MERDPFFVKKQFCGLKIAFVGHFRRILYPVSKIEPGLLESACIFDFIKEGKDSQSPRCFIRVKNEIHRTQHFWKNIDPAYCQQAFLVVVIKHLGFDRGMDQEIKVVTFGDRSSAAMPVLLILAVKLKTRLAEGWRMMLHPQILVFLPGPALAFTGFEGVGSDPDRDAARAA